MSLIKIAHVSCTSLPGEINGRDFTLITDGEDLYSGFNPQRGTFDAAVKAVGLPEEYIGYFQYDSIQRSINTPRYAKKQIFGIMDCKPLDVSGLELTGVVDSLDEDFGRSYIKLSTGGDIEFSEVVSSLGVEVGTPVKFNLSSDDQNLPIAINIRPL